MLKKYSSIVVHNLIHISIAEECPWIERLTSSQKELNDETARYATQPIINLKSKQNCLFNHVQF